MILIQLLEMMRIMFYVVGVIAILAGILLLVFHKKFKEKNRKLIIILAVILILYGICALTFGVYLVNKTIMYHKAL